MKRKEGIRWNLIALVVGFIALVFWLAIVSPVNGPFGE